MERSPQPQQHYLLEMPPLVSLLERVYYLTDRRYITHPSSLGDIPGLKSTTSELLRVRRIQCKQDWIVHVGQVSRLVRKKTSSAQQLYERDQKRIARLV